MLVAAPAAQSYVASPASIPTCAQSFMAETTSVMVGSRTLPSSTPARVRVLVNMSHSEFRVLEFCSNVLSIDEPFSHSELAFERASCKVSPAAASLSMAGAPSVPASLTAAWNRSVGSWMAAIFSAVSARVPLRSPASLPFSSSTEVPSMSAHAVRLSLLAVWDVAMLRKLLMPVDAVSELIPADIRAVPRAATWGMDCPMVVFRKEARLMKSSTSGSVAAKLSPMVLTTLPRLSMFPVSMSIPKAVKILAAAVAACSAGISKATAI